MRCLCFLIGMFFAVALATGQPVSEAPAIAPRYDELITNAEGLAESERLHRLFELQWEYRMREFPEYATAVGYPGQNDRWTDHSPGAYERRKRELSKPLEVLRSIDREKLGEADRLSYDLFGQLTYEMWRAIRLVVDTGMHALGWSRQEAIDFFKANASKTEHDIVVEVDRYIVWPGQALAYKIGELKIQELRRRAREDLGGRFDPRAFHDELLGQGPLPIELLESRMEAWIKRQDAGERGP